MLPFSSRSGGVLPVRSTPKSAFQARAALWTAGFLFFAGLAFPTPPPVVDAPLYQCSKRVRVLSYDSGAQLRIYVNGSHQATYPAASGYSQWVNLGMALDAGDTVAASQVVGGIESPASTAVAVVGIMPIPPLSYFEPPLEQCAQAVYIHNKVAGELEVQTDHPGGPLAHEAFNEGDFSSLVSRPLIGGENLAGKIWSCIATLNTLPASVSTVYSTKGAFVPAPIIEPQSAIECSSFVRLSGLIPGARVKIYNHSTLVKDGIAMGESGQFMLSSPMQPTWKLTAEQEICGNLSDRSAPDVTPIGLDELGPPILHGPIWAGQSHLIVNTPVIAPIEVRVDGSVVRDNVFIFGETQVHVETPFEAGQTVKVRFTLCGVNSPWAELTVLEPPETLPPPLVGFPLYACTSTVRVSGLVQQAEVVILIDQVEVHTGIATGGTTVFHIGPILAAGEMVRAFQRIGATKSGNSNQVVVFEAVPLDPPAVKSPIIECQREVIVQNVIPGAFVTVNLIPPPWIGEGSPIGFAIAGGTEVRVPTLPLPFPCLVRARQQLNTCQKSDLSIVSAVVARRDPKDFGKKPEIVEPLYPCQTGFDVENLPVGCELLVYRDGIYTNRLPVSSPTIHVDMQPPLTQEQIRVTVLICNEEGLSDTVNVVSQPVPAPTLQEPIFSGDPHVVVLNAPADALVRIYNEFFDPPVLVGTGMGGLPQATIPLWLPPSGNGILFATASFCGEESPPSNKVHVRGNRPPLPHDVMVMDYQITSLGVQCILFVSGRNVYQGSSILINGLTYPTFPWSQMLPVLPRDPHTLQTPIDTIGGVVMLLYEDYNSHRYQPGEKIEIAIQNPNLAPEGDLRHLLFRDINGLVFGNTYTLAPTMANLDSDGDGLTDDEESAGAPLDLTGIGANPYRQNIFVEVDFMQGSDHTHIPNTVLFSWVEDTFKKAYVLNIDGSQGIDLHVDFGQAGGEGGDLLPHFETMTFGAGADVNFDDFFNGFFSNNRKGKFHYCVFGHLQPGTRSSGLGNLLGDKLMVTLEDVSDTALVAGCFMHELGHNLGLEHGGRADVNNKHNYPSQMNYLYSFYGPSNTCFPNDSGPYNFSYGTLKDLDEKHLFEPDGLCEYIPWDWNLNALIDTFEVFRDINKDGGLGILTDDCDWCYLTGAGVK